MIEPITVVTASINRPGLRKTVESVQQQTLLPVRHCILFQQLMRSPSIDIPKPENVEINIKWILPPQPHMVDALNKAVEMADTPLVAILDDDCWWEPNHLEVLAKLMQFTDADFVWGSSIIYDTKTGAEIRRRNDSTPELGHIDTNEILFRSSCVEKWGGLRAEDHLGADGRQIERWVERGATYAHSPEFTVHYGIRPATEF